MTIREHRPTVQSLWSIQEASLRDQGAKDHQVTEMRKAYFVAFYDALVLLKDLGDVDLALADGAARLDNLLRECETFLQSRAWRRLTS